MARGQHSTPDHECFAKKRARLFEQTKLAVNNAQVVEQRRLRFGLFSQLAAHSCGAALQDIAHGQRIAPMHARVAGFEQTGQ